MVASLLMPTGGLMREAFDQLCEVENMQKPSIDIPEASAAITIDIIPAPTIEELDLRRRNLQAAIEALKAKVKAREDTEWRGGA